MKRTITKIALLLIISMLIGIVAGCDNSTTAPTTAGTTGAGTTGAGTTGAATTAGNLNPPGQMPVVKNQETIRIVMSKQTTVTSHKYGENHYTTWLQDRTNIKLDMIMFPAAEAATKLNLELSTKGDLGDLCVIQMTRDQLSTYGGQGVLLPLNKLIDKYGFYVKELLNQYGATGEKIITAPDGNIYAMPRGGVDGIQPNNFSAARFWIHSEMLRKYGKGMPTTTDEMYDFMKWVKTSDFNGNGKADEIGWTGAEKNVWQGRPNLFLGSAFSLQSTTGYYMKDDKIRYAFVEDGYRNAMKYMAKLMKEGLMDPNYINNDVSAVKTLVALGDTRTVGTISAGGMHVAADSVAGKSAYQIVPPIKGPDGFVNAIYDYYAGGISIGAPTIPAKSTKPDVVMAFLDTLFEEENYWNARYGKKGVDWDVPPKGTIAVDGGPAMYRDITNQWGNPTTAHWYDGSIMGWSKYGSASAAPAGLDNKGLPTYDLELSLYNAARMAEKYVKLCSVPPFFFDQATATKNAAYNTAIDTLCRTAMAEFIFGTRDINSDSEWAAYQAQAKAAGLDEYLKSQQAEYDRTWKGTMPKEYTPWPQRVD